MPARDPITRPLVPIFPEFWLWPRGGLRPLQRTEETLPAATRLRRASPGKAEGIPRRDVLGRLPAAAGPGHLAQPGYPHGPARTGGACAGQRTHLGLRRRIRHLRTAPFGRAGHRSGGGSGPYHRTGCYLRAGGEAAGGPEGRLLLRLPHRPHAGGTEDRGRRIPHPPG